AAERFREALRILDEKAPNSTYVPAPARTLARLLLERGEKEEAQTLMRRAESIDETVRSVPREPAPAGAAGRDRQQVTPPQARFVAPAENSEVKGDSVEVQLAFVSPIPLARYRLWVNGRPLGGQEGFDLPEKADEKGRLLERGRLLEKGDALDR